MRSLRFYEFGPPSVIATEERPTPHLREREVLVAVEASGINPSDVKVVAGAFGGPLPRTPGRDYAGTIISNGPFEGMQVWGTGPGFGVDLDGAHAELVAIPIAWTSAKPANLTMAQAASVGVPYVTAWSAIVEAAAVVDGETVLVVGASGAVGRAATQIARWRGARVIGAGRSAPNPEVDDWIDIRSGELPALARERTDGVGVDVVLDTVGGPLFEACLSALRVGGRQIAIASTSIRRVEFDLVDFYHRRLRLIGVDTLKLTGPEIAAIFDQLRVGFESGRLTPSAVDLWPFSRAIEAYETVARGGTAAKQVLQIRPSRA